MLPRVYTSLAWSSSASRAGMFTLRVYRKQIALELPYILFVSRFSSFSRIVVYWPVLHRTVLVIWFYRGWWNTQWYRSLKCLDSMLSEGLYCFFQRISGFVEISRLFSILLSKMLFCRCNFCCGRILNYSFILRYASVFSQISNLNFFKFKFNCAFVETIRCKFCCGRSLNFVLLCAFLLAPTLSHANEVNIKV